MPATTLVLVTELEFERGRSVFAAPPLAGYTCVPAPAEEAALADAVRASGARHAIVGTERYRGPLYQALGRGSVIARFGVGYDGLALPTATAAGILCANTPTVLNDAVAEHTIALMLTAARELHRQVPATLAGHWAPGIGRQLGGRRLAVIGCGAIGCRVAQTAAHGLLMEVIGCELHEVHPDEMRRKYGFTRIVNEFAEAVAEADFVSLHIPSTPATHHFLNAARLAQLPATAWLVNTARGALVDEAALYDALAAGRLAGAALDVFEHEPYHPVAPGKDLRQLPQVLMTPHCASSTAETCHRVAVRALHNLHHADHGRYEMMDLLNSDVLLGPDRA